MQVLTRWQQRDPAGVEPHHPMQLRQESLGPLGQVAGCRGYAGDLGEDLGGVHRQATCTPV
jgi:hypothetical protein